jgi:hypothetical protein
MAFEKVEAFLSCSFQAVDQDVNRLFLELCSALNISCSNVDAGSLLLPSEAARKQLEDQALLIAVCTRRDEKKSGKFDMPVAVRNEIGIAFGMKRPIQLFVEDGVELAGFEHQFGTYMAFRRGELTEPATLRNIVKTLFKNREEALLKIGGANSRSLDATKAEFINARTSQTQRNGKTVWAYKVHKKTLFAESSEPYMNTGSWLDDFQIVPDDASHFEFESKVYGSSGVERIEETVKRRDSRGISITLQFLPAPGEGDWIEYETTAYSAHMVPMWLSDTDEKATTKLKKGSFRATSGFICTTETQRLTVEQRFPRTSRLSPKDIVPFAANYTTEVDREITQETDRMTHSCRFVGDELVAEVKIERPLRDIFYGIAWNPKTEEK